MHLRNSRKVAGLSAKEIQVMKNDSARRSASIYIHRRHHNFCLRTRAW